MLVLHPHPGGARRGRRSIHCRRLPVRDAGEQSHCIRASWSCSLAREANSAMSSFRTGAGTLELHDRTGDAGRGRHIELLHVTLGSKFSKNSIGSYLRGENSLAEMLGIFFADGDQFFDHHTWQIHESGYATSDLEFKGALKDQARSVYSGLIKVSKTHRRPTPISRTGISMLSREARADTIPNLEIAANDVRCTHGATVSQVVPEHVFYLQVVAFRKRKRRS